MSDVPSRPLPAVRVASGEVPAAARPVVVRRPEAGRVTRGLAREVSVTVRDGRAVLEVEVDGSTPRPPVLINPSSPSSSRLPAAAVTSLQPMCGTTSAVSRATVPGQSPSPGR